MGLQVPRARLQHGQRRPQVNYSCCTTALRRRERLHSLPRRKRSPQSAWHVSRPSSGCPPHAEHLGSILSRLFLDGGEKCTLEPSADFWGSRLREKGLVSLTPSPAWWFRSQWVELGLERQQQGVGRSWNVPERSGSDAREMLSHGAGSTDLGRGFSAGRATRSDETGLDRGCHICKLFH